MRRSKPARRLSSPGKVYVETLPGEVRPGTDFVLKLAHVATEFEVADHHRPEMICGFWRKQASDTIDAGDQ